MNNTVPRSHTQVARLEEGQRLPMSLGDILHELGNKLVLEHGFAPAHLHGCSSHINRTTEPLVRFLVWLQHTREAGSVLRDMGVWPEDIRQTIEAAAPNGRAQITPSLPGPPSPKKTSVA
jgi:hypothetical protein